MFHSARLKLTVWYLLIIIVISGAFSTALYAGITFQLHRRFAGIEQRLKMRGPDFHMEVPPPGPPFQGGRVVVLREDLAAAKRQVLFFLIGANSIILAIAGLGGYFLAGRTLRPIEEALDEQKQFVADASHELRTPLTAMKASIEVALREKNLVDPVARAVLLSNLDDIDDLEALTANLLTLARNQWTANAGDLAPVDLKTVIETAARKVGDVACEKGVSLIVDAYGLDPRGDAASLEKLVLILLDNAIKYTPPGGSVEIKGAADGRFARIQVIDSGEGIAAQDLPHILNRFYRADKSRSKSQTRGFGLGLAIAKQIVDGHRGSIELDSKLNAGTTVTVRLPLDPV